ncbi:MAG TPA: spore germination protein GerW family protein [Capillimicrobium sp.]|nr:spore germination protein GerW family protein [Capillimicrobium sp.]
MPPKDGKKAKRRKGEDAVVAAPAPIEAPAWRRSPIAELLDRVNGVRLCYGEPVREAGRTVIPVARVHLAGGGGWGSSDAGGPGGGGAGGGGGGGGTLDAKPVGYLEIGPEGTRFASIPDPEAPMRLIKAATAAAVTVATAVAGVRAARGRRLLPRGR